MNDLEFKTIKEKLTIDLCEDKRWLVGDIQRTEHYLFFTIWFDPKEVAVDTSEVINIAYIYNSLKEKYELKWEASWLVGDTWCHGNVTKEFLYSLKTKYKITPNILTIVTQGLNIYVSIDDNFYGLTQVDCYLDVSTDGDGYVIGFNHSTFIGTKWELDEFYKSLDVLIEKALEIEKKYLKEKE